MASIIEQAKEKLNKENISDNSAKYLRELLVNGVIDKDEQLAKAILLPHKTIAKCWAFVLSYARKQARSNSYGCPDEEVIGQAIHYFTDISDAPVQKVEVDDDFSDLVDDETEETTEEETNIFGGFESIVEEETNDEPEQLSIFGDYE